MSIFEYDEEKHIRNEKELSYQEGHKSGMEAGIKFGLEQGIEQGITENMIKSVEALMNNLGLSLQKVCEGLGITIEEYEKAKQKAAYQEKSIVR